MAYGVSESLGSGPQPLWQQGPVSWKSFSVEWNEGMIQAHTHIVHYFSLITSAPGIMSKQIL